MLFFLVMLRVTDALYEDGDLGPLAVSLSIIVFLIFCNQMPKKPKKWGKGKKEKLECVIGLDFHNW